MQLEERIGKDRFLDRNPLDMAEELKILAGDSYTAAIVYPHDPWTEVGPFLGYSQRMVMAGPVVVGGFLKRSGFETRVVQQAWNPRFKPSQAGLRGRPLDILGVSTMATQHDAARKLIRDAHLTLGERPFIAGGGPKYVYQPEDAWKDRLCPDVVVTGESHIFLSLLIRILQNKRDSESILQAFCRLRDRGEFQDIPGLMFKAPGDKLELVYTGTPQLSENLQDRPLMTVGLSLLEAPGKHSGLRPEPLPIGVIKDYARMIAVPGFTEGCTRTCGFCPIPIRMQRSYRTTSQEFIAEDLVQMVQATGVKSIFVGDDSHFNSSFCERFWKHMATVKIKGKPLRGQIRIGTEGVLADVAKRLHVLPDAAEGGLAGIWFGLETLNPGVDLDKGQNTVNTPMVFKAMRQNGINPMAMTILFPDQSWTKNQSHEFGARETVRVLDEWGATYMQMLHITPSPGSAAYNGHFDANEVLSRVGRFLVTDSAYDGNRVIVDSSQGANPKEVFYRQLTILAAFWKFYHPGRVLQMFWRCWKDPTELHRNDFGFRYTGLLQTFFTSLRMIPWLWNLYWGPLVRHQTTPELKVPVRCTQDEIVVLRERKIANMSI